MKRRSWLLGALGASGLMVVGWCAMPQRQRLGSAASWAASADTPTGVPLNGWIKIEANGMISLAMPRAEMGQGIHTALCMLVAEEMSVPLSQVRPVQAGFDRLYGNVAMFEASLPFHPADMQSQTASMPVRLSKWMVGKVARELGLQITGGSSSMADAWLPIRMAAATAKALLVDAAARRLGVPTHEMEWSETFVSHASGVRWSLVELLSMVDLNAKVHVELKPSDQWRIIGRQWQRHDVVGKVKGQPVFGLDVRQPDQWFAVAALPPVLGVRIGAFNAKAALAQKGVYKVVPLPSASGAPEGVAVVARNTWLAQQGVQALNVQWLEPATVIDSARIEASLWQSVKQAHLQGHVFRQDGDPISETQSAQVPANRVLFAQYAAPYAGHYTMEPLNCTVQVLAQSDTPSVKLWVGTQVASMARAVASNITGIGLDHVQVHVTHMGGGFGRRLEVDVIAHATHVAMQCEGHPVQLLWPRDQELVHDVFRPMQVAQCRAQVSPQGVLTQWCIDTAGDAITPRWLERTLPHLAGPIETPDKTTSEGVFDAPYAIDQVRIRHVATHHPVPVGYWRSVGHSCNAFFAESFLDEIIYHLKEDPIAYRIGMLRHAPRHRRVLEVLAEMSEWGQSMFNQHNDRAQGVALHESFGTVVGQVVNLRRTPDALVVEEVWCVMDCGTVVNPDTVEQQVQGAVAFAMSAAVSASVQIEKNSVSPNMLGSHMMVHMASMPKVNVSLIPSNLAPTGVGEPAVAPFAPALANAVFALTGHRHRRLEQLLQVNRNPKTAS